MLQSGAYAQANFELPSNTNVVRIPTSGAAMRTTSPAVSESDGMLTSRSVSTNPFSTSTSVTSRIADGTISMDALKKPTALPLRGLQSACGARRGRGAVDNRRRYRRRKYAGTVFGAPYSGTTAATGTLIGRPSSLHGCSSRAQAEPCDDPAQQSSTAQPLSRPCAEFLGTAVIVFQWLIARSQVHACGAAAKAPSTL